MQVIQGKAIKQMPVITQIIRLMPAILQLTLIQRKKRFKTCRTIKIKKTKRIINMWQLLKDFLKSLHPSSYWHLAHKPMPEAYKYFLFIIFVGFIGMILVGLPKFILIPDYLQAKMQNFDELNLDLDVKMNDPVVLTSREPEIIIDTTGQLNNVSKIMKYAHLFITNDTLYYKLFFKPEKIELAKYKDVLKEKHQYATAIYYLIIFSMPSILFVTL